jgi:hypothetical protein
VLHRASKPLALPRRGLQPCEYRPQSRRIYDAELPQYGVVDESFQERAPVHQGAGGRTCQGALADAASHGIRKHRSHRLAQYPLPHVRPHIGLRRQAKRKLHEGSVEERVPDLERIIQNAEVECIARSSD